MKNLIAKCDLYNPSEYGSVSEGQWFPCNDHVARKLIAKGRAYEVPAYKPTVSAQYETRVITAEAPQVSARLPFRHGDDTHEEPPALAAVRRATSAVSDVQEPRDSDSRGRGRREGSDTK